MPSVPNFAILPKTIRCMIEVNNGLIKSQSGPRIVCIYAILKLRFVKSEISSRYCQTSLSFRLNRSCFEEMWVHVSYKVPCKAVSSGKKSGPTQPA